MLKKLSEEKWDKFVLYFCIIDILFLPYIWFISTNYSLVIAGIWFILKFNKLKNMKEFRISVILSIAVVLSTALSFIYYPKVLPSGDEIWIQNIKMMLQYISYCIYYIMFVYCIKRYKDEIKFKRILQGLLLFATVFAVIYCIDKALFATIKLKWNNVDSYSIWFKQGEYIQYRYNYIWTDPNNPAYAFVAIMTYLLLNVKTNILEKIFAVATTGFLLICSMSTGGTLSFCLVTACILALLVLPKVIKTVKQIKNKEFKFKKKYIFVITGSLAALIVLIPVIMTLMETPVYEEAMDRIIGNTDGGSSSRFNTWTRVLKGSNIFRNVLLGGGGREVVINDEAVIGPHNGHLYLIYSFGFIFYAIFIYEFFRKRKGMSLKEYIFVLPIFIGFTINTMVGEQKFVLLYLLLYIMAYMKNNTEKSEKVEKIS